MAEDGTGVLAWRRGRRVLARVRTSHGRWGPPEIAATAPPWAQIEHVALTVGSGRRSVLTVIETRRSSAGVRTRTTVHVRVAGVGWRAGTLGEFSFQPTGETAFATDQLRALPVISGLGRIRVVWPDLVGGHVRATITEVFPERGGIGTGPGLAVSDAAWDMSVDDVAAGPGGRIAVTWFDLSDGRGSPSLAEIDDAGAVRVAARLATERALLGSQVAYDPVSGRPTVIWSEGSSAQGYRLVAESSPSLTAWPLPMAR